MRSHNLRNIDLNLLPILDMLLDEKSVTLASRRIHLSQSATSSALRRLRETFNDPILVRRGQSMVASPKALLIHAALKDSLLALSEVVSTMRSKEDEDQNIEISICAPEYVTMTLTTAFRRILRHTGTSVNIVPFSRKNAVDQLERGDVDIVLGAFGRINSNVKRANLYNELLTVVMREGHPALEQGDGKTITMEQFIAHPHLLVAAGDVLEEAWISRALNAKSVVRKINAVLPSVSLVPDVLRNSDLLCVGTERAVENLPYDKRGLTYLRLPMELQLSEFDIEILWHERSDDNETLRDIRTSIIEAGRAIGDARA